jgi:hypothetical protein
MFSSLFIMKNRYQSLFKRVPVELLFWVGALTLLFLLDPKGPQSLDLCLFRFIGFDSCPGCGLGRSISFLMHGEPMLSLSAHVLGPFAFVVISSRVFTLTKQFLTIHRKEHLHA